MNVKLINTTRIPRTASKVLLTSSSFLSFVFHPLFMPPLMVLLLNKLMGSKFFSLPGALILELIIYTVVFPFLTIFLFRVSGLITNARMHAARDRFLPLTSTMIFYVWTYFHFTKNYDINLLFRVLLLAVCIAIVILFIINIFYKVSVHTSSAAILTGMHLVLFPEHRGQEIVISFIMVIVIAIIVGLIRWFLGAHTLGQILLGYLVGLSTPLAAWFWLN